MLRDLTGFDLPDKTSDILEVHRPAPSSYPFATSPRRRNIPLAYRGECVYHTLGNRGEPMSKPSDLVQGTLDLLLLKILALEPRNGWAISQRLKQISGDVLHVSDGSLYPALQTRTRRVDHRRMEAQRKQSPRKVLLAHQTRARASGTRGRQLEPPLLRHFRCRPTRGGLNAVRR